MRWGLLLFAALAGVLNTIQSGTNTQLAKALGQPGWSVAIVGCVTMLTGVAYAVATHNRLPTADAIAHVSWWGWVGGMLGAVFVLSALLVAKEVGAAVFLATTVTAGVVTSLAMDHFGMLGFDVHPAGAGRLAGGALMVAGLVLIAHF